MRTRRIAAAVGATAMVTAGLGVATAAPALAAPPPSCVTTTLDASGTVDYLRIINNCSTPQRVKVVLDYATDLACRTIPARTTVILYWGYPGRFDRLDAC
ncbi:hypothetical protein [Actinoplanes sp. M2I2]|uniref:hypothetical protein n=1 Tax=Actinoplanes sp. M2I2 TaxID=1734444 RepID=UPI0020202633|nr:hypothetical protein [Actinoplanes sp. M2I2]